MSIKSALPASQHDTKKCDIEMLEDVTAKNDLRDPVDGLQEYATRTPEEAKIERRLLLKADLIILPLIFIAYLLDFLVSYHDQIICACSLWQIRFFLSRTVQMLGTRP